MLNTICFNTSAKCNPELSLFDTVVQIFFFTVPLVLQHMHYAWVFADLDFSASRRTWNGVVYHLNRSSSNNKKLLNLTVTADGIGIDNPVFILQIAGPWNVEGT